MKSDGSIDMFRRVCKMVGAMPRALPARGMVLARLGVVGAVATSSTTAHCQYSPLQPTATSIRQQLQKAFQKEPVSWPVLLKQNAISSQAIINYLEDDFTFIAFSKAQEVAILARDAEDEHKLAKGIQLSIDRGALPADPYADPYLKIDVLGKTPDQVTAEITESVGEASKSGAVIVLCGLSGTGKGTTVQRLAEQLPNTVTWSNGNIFRSVTLLAATWSEQNGKELSEALTADNLKAFMGMLSFGQFDGAWTARINGLGIDALISDIQNTCLKGPKVGANIPTVAQETQGEVVAFASGAIEQMSKAGLNVLLEGRQQTVDYVPSKFRFTLTLSDTSVIGQRRAAQVIGANTLKQLQQNYQLLDCEPTTAEVGRAIKAACKVLLQ